MIIYRNTKGGFTQDVRETFPDSTGFSYSNVKYMKQWYSFYYERITKSHQAGGQLAEQGTKSK